MKKNFLFLMMAVAMSSVQCTHNYYYGTVYTTPGQESTHSSHSSTVIHGSGSGSGSSGNTTGSGTTQTDLPGRPTGSGTGTTQADPPGRPTGSNTPGTTSLPQSISTRNLYRTWMHSHEEDQGDVQVYRPSTFAFPPSRGRTGYTFDEKGKVIQHDIAPTDGTVSNTGNWTLRNRTLQISSINGQRPYQLEILTLDDNVMKVKRR